MNRPMLWTILVVAMLSLTPAQAGTANNPEIVDPANDSNPFGDAAIPSLDITKAWVQPKDDKFHFVMEVASLGIPEKDHVFVFHYTWQSLRLYFRANWSEERQSFTYLGGLFDGVKDPTRAYDPEGNRNYFYMPGSASQQERLTGELIPGAPGRIVWTYPLESFTGRQHLEFKGLFVTTYLKRADGSLQYVDTALAATDYVHKIHTPWYAQFLPGPPIALVAMALVGIVGLTARAARRP